MSKKRIISRKSQAIGSGAFLIPLGFSAPLLFGFGGVANAQESASATLEEIVVTARKREESMQSTPIAITNISGDEFASRGFDKIDNISQIVPNMTFNSTATNSGSSNAAVVFIRGVGQSDFYPQIDPGVGIYLDGVYIARTTGSVLDTVDIEQIEILRGPQGTLFGKNTIGGAISIRSRQPGEEFAAQLAATFGSYERTDVRVTADLPLSDNFLSRISLSSLNRDGYIESLHDGTEYGNRDALIARWRGVWQASEKLSADFILDYTRSREESSGNTLIAVDPGTFDEEGNLVSGVAGFVHNAFIVPATGAPPYDDRWITNDPYKNYGNGNRSQSDLDLWGASVTLDWDISDLVTMKSITAYRASDSVNDLDNDASPAVILHAATRIDQNQFSQEFQFLGDALDGSVNWLVGAFYLSEDINFLAPVEISFVYIDNSAEVENTSYAAFSQVNWAINDQWSITPGIRYTYEEKKNDTVIFTTGPDIPNPVSPPPGTVLLVDDASEIFEEFTPSLSLNYQWTEDLLVYASYSQGFKSGGFSQRIAFPRESSPSFDPETVTSYELGFKWTSDDSRLRINAATYFADYEDLQVVVFNQIEPINENAGQAEIKGFEVELTALMGSHFTFTTAVGYTDAEYTEIEDPRTMLTLDNKLAYTPEWTANASLVYDTPIDGLNGDLQGRLDWSYRDEVYLDSLNSPYLLQESYSLFNASVIYTHMTTGWKVAAGVTNIGDEEYLVTGRADLTTSGIVDGTYARPREWYVTLSFSF